MPARAAPAQLSGTACRPGTASAADAIQFGWTRPASGPVRRTGSWLPDHGREVFLGAQLGGLQGFAYARIAVESPLDLLADQFLDVGPLGHYRQGAQIRQRFQEDAAVRWPGLGVEEPG